MRPQVSPARARPCAVIALAGCATALGLCLSLARLTAASASDQRRATGRRTDAKSPAGHPGHLPKFEVPGAAPGSDPATGKEVAALPGRPRPAAGTRRRPPGAEPEAKALRDTQATSQSS